MRSQQSGSAHAFLIIGLVVALMGALGFVFWQNFIYKEPAAKQETVVVTKKSSPKSVEAQPQSFSVKDYGVRFTVPTGLSDPNIKYESRQIGEASYLAFTTQRVVELGGDCAKGHPFGDLVTLSRDNQPSSDQYEVYTSEKIDGYYYHVSTIESSGLEPKSSCPSNPQAKKDLDYLVAGLKILESQN